MVINLNKSLFLFTTTGNLSQKKWLLETPKRNGQQHSQNWTGYERQIFLGAKEQHSVFDDGQCWWPRDRRGD